MGTGDCEANPGARKPRTAHQPSVVWGCGSNATQDALHLPHVRQYAAALAEQASAAAPSASVVALPAAGSSADDGSGTMTAEVCAAEEATLAAAREREVTEARDLLRTWLSSGAAEVRMPRYGWFGHQCKLGSPTGNAHTHPPQTTTQASALHVV